MRADMKLDFEGILKRGICGLICFFMVFAAVSLWSGFSFCALGLGEKTIDVFIYNDLNKTKDNMNKALNEDDLKQADVINMIIMENISICPKDCIFGVFGMGDGCFFNFTNGEFEGKTINIKSNNNEKFKIVNKNETMGFLKAKNCTVVLENIVLDGGGIYKYGQFSKDSIIRSQSFIEIEQRGEKIAALNLKESSVNNCVCNAACGGAISSKGAVVSLDKNSSITNCNVFDDNNISGGAIDLVGGMFVMSGKSFIDGCHVNAEEDAFGGAIFMKGGTVILRGGSYITNCSVGAFERAWGGAIALSEGILSLNESSYISNCVVSANQDASGGGIDSKGGMVNMFGGDITTCIVNGDDSAFGGGICLLGGCFNMMGKSSITGCMSKSDSCSFGGGIYAFGGELNLKSGNIFNCSAKNCGDAVHFGGDGKYSLTKPGGDLKISILSKDNSHNSDAKVLGYWGIYMDGIKQKEDEKNLNYHELKLDTAGVGDIKSSCLNFVYIPKKNEGKDIKILSYLPKKLKNQEKLPIKWVYNDGFVDREIDQNTGLAVEKNGVFVMINRVKAIYQNAA